VITIPIEKLKKGAVSINNKILYSDINPNKTIIRPNELLYFKCPIINNYLEGFIFLKLKNNSIIQLKFSLFFFSLNKNPPAIINLLLPEGIIIDKELNESLYNSIFNIFIELRKEKEGGTTFDDKLRELIEYNTYNMEVDA